ncbi:MAG: SpoIID/LytB domain-containing protein [Candidatus Korobacteraceae bacterium]
MNRALQRQSLDSPSLTRLLCHGWESTISIQHFRTAALVLAFLLYLAPSASAAARSTLRVGLWTMWHDREITLTPAGPTPAVITLRTCAGCAGHRLTQPVQLRATGNRLTLTAGRIPPHPGEIDLAAPVTLSAHGETLTLHHPVTITAREGRLILAVTLPVESYVASVVASESSPADSAASLQALAIVVRTFALHEPHGHTDYDLCDSTHCQLLRWHANPVRLEAARTAALVTASETLWFRGHPALAYFGKDCGGHTASPAEIWPGARVLPYLPVRPDPYCVRDGGHEWASEITRAELTAALAMHGLARPGWRTVAVVRRGPSGRVVMLRVDATEIQADEFRLATGESLGWNRVPSTWFEVSQQGDRFFFHGRGWGNGVGLCQRGAAAMAAEGLSTLQILEQYFPGAEAADEANGGPWRSFPGPGFVLQSLDAADRAYLPALAQARAEASQRSGLNTPVLITVRAFTSTPAFRSATLAPGWVAAFTQGNWIATQPLRTLAGRHLLASTLRHEFLHALVEGEVNANTPLWLREGLVEAWADAASVPAHPPALSPAATEAGLANSTTEEASTTAHHAAAWYASRLLERYGRGQTLAWLRSGLPAGVSASLGGR